MFSTIALILTLVCYTAGTVAVLLSLFSRSVRMQNIATAAMAVGLVAHTLWIGTICVRTSHPPLTNLPEITAFISWTMLALLFLILWRFRIRAAAFFVYPLALLLMIVSALVHERYRPLDAGLRSNLFIAHLLFTTVGIAALLLGLAFSVLYQVQQRSLKQKRQGRLYDWIPSLQMCDVLSYRSLSIGFAVYTLGLLAGVLFSYRMTAELFTLRAKEVGALAAWVSSAVLLHAYVAGEHRRQSALIIAVLTFLGIVVAILGIHHV